MFVLTKKSLIVAYRQFFWEKKIEKELCIFIYEMVVFWAGVWSRTKKNPSYFNIMIFFVVVFVCFAIINSLMYVIFAFMDLCNFGISCFCCYCYPSFLVFKHSCCCCIFFAIVIERVRQCCCCISF